jgi:hypothetical protein
MKKRMGHLKLKDYRNREGGNTVGRDSLFFFS